MSEPTGALRPAVLKLALPADLRQVRHAAQTVHGFLAEQGCDEEILMACDLALVEACNNAIKYAPENTRAVPVTVEAVCESAQVELRITDHTLGFDWPERVELPEAESESGRGLYLIQSLMDSASYLRGQCENILVLRKNRPAAVTKSEMAVPANHSPLVSELLEELSSCYESLSAIFRYGAEQTKISDLKTFGHRLLSDLQTIVGADWFVFRIARNGATLETLVASEPAFDLPPLSTRARAGEHHSSPRLESESASIPALEVEAAIARREVWFDEERPLSAADPLPARAGSRGVIQPVFVGENFIGTLAIGKNRPHPTAKPKLIFTAGQTNVIATFAHFLAIQIVNARYQEEQLHHRVVARELELAGNIQRSLLLKELPPLPGFELAAFCQSAHQVGGDFYDVLKLDDDSALLVIADVMGKGVLAAMFAAILRTVLRASPDLTTDPAALLTRVNRLLYEELSGVDMFITAQLAHINARTRELTVASAGHCPLLVWREGMEIQALSPEGMPLGILPDTVFADEVVKLPGKCRVLLYTDGLTEAADAEGERYGQERLTDWLAQAGSRLNSARELKQELAETLGQFQTKSALNDDQTFLIMTG